ncbi:hypothetical protein [Staphylococcus phage PMBT8]|nr:hypothetical protein [Staphylococcus phage PMBT8]
MELRESKRYKGYFSDKEGNIYSNRRGEIVLKKLRKDKDGYLITSVIDDVKGFETTARAHRIVVACSRMLNICKGNIHGAIKHNQKIYDFLELKTEDKEETSYKLSIIKSFNNLNPFINRDTGEMYYNIRDMSNKTQVAFSGCQYYITRGYNNKNEKIDKRKFLIDSNYIK